MAQVTIYLDEDTEKRVKKAARSERVSLSKWIASALRQKTEATWPKAVLDLEGAWPDFPSLDQLRRAAPRDVRREKF
jgi:predicted transcriptional regulator